MNTISKIRINTDENELSEDKPIPKPGVEEFKFLLD
jgi:hypothetical protein